MNHESAPRTVNVSHLADLHRAIFLDAYGVLVDSRGAIPGAPEMIAYLNARRAPYLVLTNDASRLPETMERRFQGFGLAIRADAIVSSGSLLREYFAERRLHGARCVVVGTEDSRRYVEAAGGTVIEASEDARPDVLAVCDESGAPALRDFDTLLTMTVRALDAGHEITMVLPNPDVIYPRAGGAFGYSAGSVALLLEHALALRFPSRAPQFVRLGKPFAPIFEAGCVRANTRDAVMVGDQLVTDIRGANEFGIASALAATGLTRFDEVAASGVRPTYLLPSLATE